jgi:hypothetical protein
LHRQDVARQALGDRYAYLANISADDGQARTRTGSTERCSELSSAPRPLLRSRWFGRGWALQELIVPYKLTFSSLEWKLLVSKSDCREAGREGSLPQRTFRSWPAATYDHDPPAISEASTDSASWHCQSSCRTKVPPRGTLFVKPNHGFGGSLSRSRPEFSKFTVLILQVVEFLCFSVWSLGLQLPEVVTGNGKKILLACMTELGKDIHPLPYIVATTGLFLQYSKCQ